MKRYLIIVWNPDEILKAPQSWISVCNLKTENLKDTPELDDFFKTALKGKNRFILAVDCDNAKIEMVTLDFDKLKFKDVDIDTLSGLHQYLIKRNNEGE